MLRLISGVQCCDVITGATDHVTADASCVALLLLREERSDHQGAQHEAQADHGVQRRREGRAPGRAERVEHQRVARSVQAANEHPGDRHNYYKRV